MNREKNRLVALTAAAALCVQAFGLPAFAEEAEDVTGSLGFVRLDEDLTVNVRADAYVESDVVGTLRSGAGAVIEEVAGDGWYRIRSGEVEGYVAAYLLATGEEAEEIAAQTTYTYVRVNAESLNVRSSRGEEAEVLTALESGSEAEVVEAYDGGAFVHVCVDADTYGYVNADYVELVTDYPKADPVAQEEPEDAWSGAEDWSDAGTAAQTDSSWLVTDTGAQTGTTADAIAADNSGCGDNTAAQSSAAAGAQTAQDTSAQSSAAADTTQAATASATGSAIVAYASQFVGNPYVWGGTSLTNGADCSGFTMAVFAHFGISLPHDAASQYGCGTPVSTSALAPGDLVFFSSSGGAIDHVAIYAGGGGTIHAANSSSGICYGSLSFGNVVGACRVV